MNDLQKQAELLLFKAYTDLNKEIKINNTIECNSVYVKNLLKHGIIINDMSKIPDNFIIDKSIEYFGVDALEWNKTFHKSFSTVKNSSMEDLVIDQILHYMTTYGFESLGIYNDNNIYIPHETLNIPELEENISLNVIRYLTEDQLRTNILDLLTSSIALSKDSIENIMLLSDYIDPDDFDKIKNKEIKIALYDKYNKVPKNNIEFLRFLIYKTTGDTLLIKNKDTINKIKNCDKNKALQLFNIYLSQPNAYKNLGKIFWRYKDLFIAFKDKLNTLSEKDHILLNNIINKLDKYARKYHQCANIEILDNITKIRTMTQLAFKEKEILQELDNVTIFKLISILNMLNFRINNNILTKKVNIIRNGKMYVNDIHICSKEEAEVYKHIYDMIYNYLISYVQQKLKDKSVYIPSNIVYALPESEKKFINNIPEGSYIKLSKEDLVIGINWKNIENLRVDLDLKLQNKNESYGWNTSYRSETDDFYFSGDVTSAPNGACELFYIGSNCSPKSFFMTVNDYTQVGQKIPFKQVVAKVHSKEHINASYVIDPNDILLIINNCFDNNESHKLLNFIDIKDDEIYIYFRNNTLENGKISYRSDYINEAQAYLELYYNYQITLNDVLKDAGINITNEPFIEKLEPVNVNNEILYKKVKQNVDINLSLDYINKDSLINLFK